MSRACRRGGASRAWLATALALAALGQSVAQADPVATTAVTSSVNPSLVGQSTTFTAKVTASDAGTPTGTITFKDGTNTIGSPTALFGVGVGRTIVATHNSTCVLTSTGGVKCWGIGTSGQLGNGGVSSSLVPVDVTGLSGVQALAGGSVHVCALTAAGGVKCWGLNDKGQLGDGTTTNRTTPVDVVGLNSGVVAIAAGYADGNGGVYTCALTNAGIVKCWGDDALWQLGDGTTGDGANIRATPVTAQTNSIAAITAGAFYTCGVTTTGGVKCWGVHTGGVNGDIQFSTPTARSELANGVSDIAAGNNHTCVLTTAGGVKCWGKNDVGQLGIGSTNDSETAVDSGLTSGVSAIIARGDSTCALTTGGGAKCWGANVNGRLGAGSGGFAQYTSPLDVTDLSSGVVDITLGSAHGCAVLVGGSVKCWGNNVNGVFGNGSQDGNGAVKWTPVAAATGVTAMVFARATLATSFATKGPHTITAVYGGDGTYAGSTSPDLNQSVQQATSTFFSGAQLTVGTNVTLVALVFDTSTSDVAATTATVTYKEGTTELGTASMSPQGAGLSLSTLAVGTHTITAFYAGDGNYAASTSVSADYVIVPSETTVSLGVAPGAAPIGSNVVLTATVSATTAEAGTPDGDVTFTDTTTSTMVGQATLASGVASLQTASLPLGSHAIVASYLGSSNFNTSDSSSQSATISKVATTTSLVATPNPSKPKQVVTLKATVSGAILPTGSVTFKEGATTLGTGTLSAGQATFTTGALKIGGHAVTASYGGSATHATSSGGATVTVDPKIGPEFLVNTRVLNAQQFPAIAFLANGNFVVTWASNLQDGSGYGVYAQRYNASATRLGVEFRVNTVTAHDQTTPAIAATHDGGFTIVWTSTGQDGSGLGIYGRRYTAAGAPLGGEFKINTVTANDQSLPSVAGLRAGGFVVAWTSKNQDGSGLGVYAQRFDNAGRAAGAQFKVNTATAGDQSAPATAALTGGGFAIGWQSGGQDGSGLGVYGQRYDAAGRAVGVETRLNTVIANDQSMLALTPSFDGGFVAMWQSQLQDTSGLGIYGQRFAANGMKAGVEFRVNTTIASDQSQPAIAPYGKGFMVVWMSKGQDGAGQGIYAQAYTTNGAIYDVEYRVNITTAKDQTQPAIAMTTGGSFAVVWTSRDQDTSLEGVYGQRFNIPIPLGGAAADPSEAEGAVAVRTTRSAPATDSGSP